MGSPAARYGNRNPTYYRFRGADRNHEYRTSLVIVAIKRRSGWCTLATDYRLRYEGPAQISLPKIDMENPTCLNE